MYSLCSNTWLLPLQILQKLLERLTGEQLQVPEVTQSEEGQRSKLRVVLGFANHILGLQRGQAKWSVESVHTKNIVSILHLLVSNFDMGTCAFSQHCTTTLYYYYITFIPGGPCPPLSCSCAPP